jgi:hypothetical protein
MTQTPRSGRSGVEGTEDDDSLDFSASDDVGLVTSLALPETTNPTNPTYILHMYL